MRRGTIAQGIAPATERPRRALGKRTQMREADMAQDMAKKGGPVGPSAKDAADCEKHREELLDDALDDSFPASDPPSIAQPAKRRCWA